MIDKLGGRKFIAFIVVLILLLTLVFFNKITGDTFVQFITANLAIFTAGNVGENVASKL